MLLENTYSHPIWGFTSYESRSVKVGSEVWSRKASKMSHKVFLIMPE